MFSSRKGQLSDLSFRSCRKLSAADLNRKVAGQIKALNNFSGPRVPAQHNEWRIFLVIDFLKSLKTRAALQRSSDSLVAAIECLLGPQSASIQIITVGIVSGNVANEVSSS